MKSVPILLVTISIIFFITFFIDIDQYIPGFSNYLPFMWIPLLGIEVYRSIKYLTNKSENEIRLRSNNDSYLNMVPFILEVLICLYSIVSFFIDENEKMISIFFIILGILLILQGIFIIPSALIKKEKKNLYFENGKQKHFIEIEQIESILFTKNDLRFKIKDDTSYFFQHLELNQTDIDDVKIFFQKHIDENIQLG